MSETLACPECDSAHIDKKIGVHDGVTGHRCYACGEYFDEPVRREKKSSGARHGLSKHLADADPDDLDALLSG